MSVPKIKTSDVGSSGKVSDTITVCVVEDDRWLRQDLARQMNQAAGFKCLGSWGNAEEALLNLPALHPDVVLMDINLPGMNGIECVRRLREVQPEAAVLILTVYEESDQIFSALRAGASGYMLKRSSPQELFEAITDVHQGGSPMSSSVARRVVKFFANEGAAKTSAEGLSPRENDILNLLTKGHAYKEIADRLSISTNTVRMFIRRIYKKLHIHSRSEAMAMVRNPPADSKPAAKK